MTAPEPAVAEPNEERVPAVLQIGFFLILAFWYAAPFLAELFLSAAAAENVRSVAAISFWPLVLVYFAIALAYRRRRDFARIVGYAITLAALGFLKPFLGFGMIGISDLLSYSPLETTVGRVRNIEVRNLDRSGRDPSYTAFVEYEYRVDDTTYSRVEALDSSAASTEETTRRLVDSLIKDQTVTVYYLPNQPRECSLSETWSPFLGVLVMLGFGSVALALVVTTIMRFRLIPVDLEAFGLQSAHPARDLVLVVLGLVVCLVLVVNLRGTAAIMVALGLVLLGVARSGRLYELLLLVSVTLFLFSVLVHLGSVVHVTPYELGDVFWLHLVIFVLFIPLLFRQLGTRNGTGRVAATRNLASAAPHWMKTVLAALFAYALFNFFFCTFHLLEGGSAGVIEGKKVLHDHGRIVRELDAEEYESMKDAGFRAMSGHWMFFYWFAVVSFSAAVITRRGAVQSRDGVHLDSEDPL